MSKKVLFGSFDTLSVLLFLNPKSFITSRKIREEFNLIKPGTIMKKLKKLEQQGLVEKKTKRGNFAGDDRTEFKLSEDGVKLRVQLVSRGLEVLNKAVNHIVKQKIARKEQPRIEDKKEQITNFIMEFTGESKGLVNTETLKEQQKLLERLLNNIL